jgi:hypothetical protein
VARDVRPSPAWPRQRGGAQDTAAMRRRHGEERAYAAGPVESDMPARAGERRASTISAAMTQPPSCAHRARSIRPLRSLSEA